MKNIPLLAGTVIGSLLLVVGIAFFFSSGNSPGGNYSQDGAANETISAEDESKILGEARHSKGPEDAKITIVEYSDFQCPACKAASPLVEQVTAQYPDDVRFVYRHYPLVSLHQYAQLAAQASEVAAENDLFWEYHDLLFERQQEWSKLGSQGAVRDRLIEYATELGIDTDQFRERITSSEIRELVLQDVSDGTAIKISGTPTLFVNNQRVSAPHLLPSLVEALLEETTE